MIRKTSIIGWIARVTSILSLMFFLLMAVGEGFNPRQLRPDEILRFLFFPVGVCIGMIVGWWFEGIGGAISLVSLGIFYLIHLLISGGVPNGPWFLILAFPGLLFLISWIYCKKRIL